MASSKDHKTPRANYVVRPEDITSILTHRRVQTGEEYLIRWKTPGAAASEVVSWNTIPELRRCLYLVQAYLETLPKIRATTPDLLSLAAGTAWSRKRKSPHDESTDTKFSPNVHAQVDGIKLNGTRAPSASSSVSSASIAPDNGPRTYNGVFSKRAGVLVPTRCSQSGAPQSEATLMPTRDMLDLASRTPTPLTDRAIREAFIEKLKPLKGVTVENDVDSSTPSLNFTFIKEYVLREGIAPQDPEAFEGCSKCKPDMGQGIGCEYTQKCGCLEYAAVDVQKLQAKDPELYQDYLRREANHEAQRPDLPRRFPYTKPSVNDEFMPQRLLPWYRESRHAIYECNDNCACGPRCKSRLVQKGRRVPLTIFKTKNRGWGVKCNLDLVQGQFVDTYLGEVITSEETDRREAKSGKEKASYLYVLDKFVGDPLPGQDKLLTEEDCYVVDGQYMGGPTRFINHSCEPNCRQYTVSYDKNNILLYNLAFFAYTDIPAGTELTFDYVDQDELEEVDAILKREENLSDPEKKDWLKCNCGSVKCRGILWM